MNELIIFTMLLAAVCVGLLIALYICIRKIIKLQEKQDRELVYMAEGSLDTIACWIMDIFGQINRLETQMPNRYKNQNGEIGILYRKEEDK